MITEITEDNIYQVFDDLITYTLNRYGNLYDDKKFNILINHKTNVILYNSKYSIINLCIINSINSYNGFKILVKDYIEDNTVIITSEVDDEKIQIRLTALNSK